MDLLSIVRTLWRHKIAAVIVILATFGGTAYVYFATPPIYETTVSYAIVSPVAPTLDEIREKPALGKIDTNNPFLRFGDQTVLITILGKRVNSDVTKTQLIAQGADPRYEVLPSNRFGTTPIVDITIDAATAEGVRKTSKLVGKAVTDQLKQAQAAEGVDPNFMITLLPVPTDDPKLRTSGKLRSLISVIGLGAFLLLVVVSGLQALERSRDEKQSRNGSGDRQPRASGDRNDAEYYELYDGPPSRAGRDLSRNGLVPDQSDWMSPAAGIGPTHLPHDQQPPLYTSQVTRPQAPVQASPREFPDPAGIRGAGASPGGPSAPTGPINVNRNGQANGLNGPSGSDGRPIVQPNGQYGRHQPQNAQAASNYNPSGHSPFGNGQPSQPSRKPPIQQGQQPSRPVQHPGQPGHPVRPSRSAANGGNGQQPPSPQYRPVNGHRPESMDPEAIRSNGQLPEGRPASAAPRGGGSNGHPPEDLGDIPDVLRIKPMREIGRPPPEGNGARGPNRSGT